MITWLKDTIFYEIYPQSFYDTNGDGIGDIEGIIQKLDYIKNLGCNGLWINPWFDSPFKDAGYDVRDYKKVAPRYGTNEDARRLFEAAHERGIRVLLDLVAGHTSEEHEWFVRSGKAQPDEYADRYIWTDFWVHGTQGYPYIAGEAERNGVYMLNFFKCQPALNYGWKNVTEPWQFSIDSEAAASTRAAMVDVMRFWLNMGADGFRVDMASSLVKGDDEQKSGTALAWRDMFSQIRPEYPDAAFVSEWNNPRQALSGAGFDMDFYLDFPGNGYSRLVRDYETPGEDRSYFRKGSGADIRPFLTEYLERYEATKADGYISFLTCNHDTIRMNSGSLDENAIRLAYCLLFTLPGVPFLYYGDEVGMCYREDQPTVEGGYIRTGSRTPMQWTDGENAGFSTAKADALYLPVEAGKHAADKTVHSVSVQEGKAGSMLETVRSILKLRHEEEDLQADAPFGVVCDEPGKPFVYLRGDRICAINPTGETLSFCSELMKGRKARWSLGEVKTGESSLVLGPQSFAVL